MTAARGSAHTVVAGLARRVVDRLTSWLRVCRDHPRHVALAALVAGLLSPSLAVGTVVALVGLLVALTGSRRTTVVVLALAATGAGTAQWRLDAMHHPAAAAAGGAAVAGDAVLLERPRPRSRGRAAARVRWLGGPLSGAVLVAALPADGPPPAELGAPGAVLRLAGRVAPLPHHERHQRRRGAHALLRVSTVAATSRRRAGVIGALDTVRGRAERGLAAGIDPAGAALLRGMVLGQDEGIAPSLREAFERSGLAHLLAVSGQNVMLLAALAMVLAAAAGGRLRARLLVALALVALYVPVTGAGPTVQRAAVMGAAGLVAALAGRPSSRWYALGLAAAVTLAANPLAAGDAGWQLSFAAVASLLLLVPPSTRLLVERRVPRPAAEVAAITLAASIGTGPLLAHHFGEVSVVSPLANLLVAPVVAPVMWLGMLAAMVSQVSPSLAEPLNAANAPLLGLVSAVAGSAAGVSWATAPASLPSPAAVAAAYAALLALAAAALRAARAERPGPGASRRRGIRLALAASLFLTGAVLATGGGRTAPALAADELRVSFLDVGQGHATLLERRGGAVLVDTGADAEVLQRRLRQSGVERLDLLVLTHASLDHDGAAIDLLRRRQVPAMLDGGTETQTPARAAIERVAAAERVRRTVAHAGQVVRLHDAILRVLWPPPGAPADDPNDRAVVLLLSWRGFDLLLPADAEARVTTGLSLPRLDALQVAHHGSADPALPALLERTNPRHAVISAGRRNPYGHPAPSTLAAIRAAGPRLLRTDRDGTVRLRVRGGRVEVVTDG